MYQCYSPSLLISHRMAIPKAIPHVPCSVALCRYELDANGALVPMRPN
jgi:hypothetical protein